MCEAQEKRWVSSCMIGTDASVGQEKLEAESLIYFSALGEDNNNTRSFASPASLHSFWHLNISQVASCSK